MRILAMRSASGICNILAGGFLLLVFAAGSAEAQTPTTAQMNVELQILPGCSIGFGGTAEGGAGSVDFGSVSKSALAKGLKAAPVNLSVLCSKGACMSYTIAMSHGSAAAGAHRAMIFQGLLPNGAADSIQYDICQTADVNGSGWCVKPWGETDSKEIYQGTWSGADSATQIPVYVVVPPVPSFSLSAIAPGSYADTVVAQIAYDGSPNPVACPSGGK